MFGGVLPREMSFDFLSIYYQTSREIQKCLEIVFPTGEVTVSQMNIYYASKVKTRFLLKLGYSLDRFKQSDV